MFGPIKTLEKKKNGKRNASRANRVASARAGQINSRIESLTDEKLTHLLDKSFFKTGNFAEGKVTAQNFYDAFFKAAEQRFFTSFAQKEKTLEIFRQSFGEKSASFFIEKAKSISEGKFDLLGYKNLDFGAAVDWHLEPISGRRFPVKPWKHFEETIADEIGDPKIIYELNRCQHFFTLGVSLWLIGDERCAETFVRHLESWMQQNPVGTGINWSSSLEVSLRAISWIWAFNFFKDTKCFTPEIFCSALKFLYLHARHIEKYLSTYLSPNTHLTGEALGLYYLGTQLPFFERAAHWRKLGEEILISELEKQISDDGVYFEQSTWFARNTIDFYTHFLALKSLNNENDLPEKLKIKLQSALDFLMYITRPDGTTPFVGDDDGGGILPLGRSETDDFRACLSNGAVLFGRADYKFVAKDLAEETLWLFGAEASETFEKLEERAPEKTSCQFKAGGYFVMRDGWTETDNYLLIDGGELGALKGGHGHADALAVNAAVGGRTTLVDSGTYTYHETKRLRDYFRSTAAHNTLTVDEKSQSEAGGKFDWQTKANSTVNRWISEPRFDFFEGSHDGYERLNDAATHNRSVLFLKNDYWIFRDFVKTTGKHDYALNFHFNAETNPSIEKAANGNFCVSETGAPKAGARLFTFGDNGRWQRKESWISNHYGSRANAPFLRFVSRGVGAQEFFTFLLPHAANFDAPEVVETFVDNGRAFVVNYRGYQDLLVFADDSEIVRTEFFNTNFNFLWARLGAGEDLPEEFVLIGGSQFTLGGREVVNYPHDLEFAAARRLGSKLNVRTSEGVFSVSIPKKHSPARIF